MNQVSGVSENLDLFVNFNHSNVEIGVNSVKLAILASKIALSYAFQKSC